MDRKSLDELQFLIEEGVYVLKRDVKNQKPDRRYLRTFDAAETWIAGTLIQVRLNLDQDCYCPVLRCLWSPQPRLVGDLVCQKVNKAQWEPLLDAMDNPPQTVGTLLAMLEAEGIGWIEANELLAMLVVTHKTSYQELLGFARLLAAMEDTQFRRWRKNQGLE